MKAKVTIQIYTDITRIDCSKPTKFSFTGSEKVVRCKLMNGKRPMAIVYALKGAVKIAGKKPYSCTVQPAPPCTGAADFDSHLKSLVCVGLDKCVLPRMAP